MEDKTKIKLWAITHLSMLEALALIMGVDGVMFGAVVMAISGIGGYEIGKRWKKNEG